MAMVRTNPDKRVFQIRKWLGVNENPDGDVKLKPGEAAEMRNFRVTRDGNLQIRPGTHTVLAFGSPVRGLWCGNVGGREVTVAAADGRLWELDLDAGEKTELSALTDAPTHFFGFARKLYVLNGHEYIVWDGENEAAEVEGYRPLVKTVVEADGKGILLEAVNKLTGAKRARLSPDGTAVTFQLPETDLLSVDYAKSTVTGGTIEHSANLAAGTVTFSAPPAKGVNSIEIGWTSKECDRRTVEGMRFSELFNGATDTRLFLAGDGSNNMIYSGIMDNGQPSAEYFPDLNVAAVGSANTAVTGMIRHFSSLVIFKSDSAYSMQHGSMTVAEQMITTFSIAPVNRDIGNGAPGQVRLVGNNPLTLSGNAVYEWKSVNAYLALDERNAQRISGRVSATLSRLNLAACVTHDDEERQEYFIAGDGRALVYNYDEDAWYEYTNFPAVCFLSKNGELYIGTSDGRLCHVSRRYRNDDGAAIDAFWRSGSMAFDRDWMRKHSTLVFVAIKPESSARITVTARSNRKSDYPDKVVASGLSTYVNVDYNHWSYATNRQPQVRRIKLKVKKAAYYQLIFESVSASATATVLACDISVRYTGNVK